MTKKIQVTEWLSHCDNMAQQGMSLWLTPGASAPYWSNNANFKYDQVVASPWDFLDTAGYDAFCDDHNFDGCDEQIAIEIDWIDPAPYMD